MLQTAIYAACRWTGAAGIHTIDDNTAIDTITLLQMEIEELKEKNNTLVQEVQSAQHGREELERENSQLKEQQQGWQERLQALLGRMEEV